MFPALLSGRHAAAVRVSSLPIALRLLLLLAVLLPATQLTTSTALGAGGPQPQIVTSTPDVNTPNVLDGSVLAFAEVGSQILAGGSFTQVAQPGSTTGTNHRYLVAFDKSTGAVNQSFAAHLDGSVDALADDPDSNAVYAGGRFTTAGGTQTRLVKLNAVTGDIVPGWSAPSINGDINAIEVAAGKLFVAGTFTKAGPTSSNLAKHAGLIAVDPADGHLLSYVNTQVQGHHSWTPSNGYAKGATGISQIDVSPDGSKLVAVGNFTSVDGRSRDQIVRLNLGLSSLSVDTSWRTYNFTARCSRKFDATIRDVRYSPNGTYFAVVSSGAGGLGRHNTDGTVSSCDSIQRFDSAGTGPVARPTWTDHTGNDSLWSVETTGAAIYAGGHFRWLNNSFGQDFAAAGAVPRPGIVAVDPSNGLPLAWNPGRNPRGVGTRALLGTPDGLYVGSDTDYFGNRTYRRAKIGFFPLAGGAERAPNQTGTLPGTVYQAGGFAPSTAPLTSRHYDGTTVGPTVTETGTLQWRRLRGAFTVDHTLYYGKANGYLYQRAIAGKSFGSVSKVDPYNDPGWSNVPTGSTAGQTYRGVLPTFYSEDLAHVTSMFYDSGRIYYTLVADATMYWRYFSPESGIIGADRFSLASATDWSDTAGAFLSDETLYFATKSDADLHAVHWTAAGAQGPVTVADASQDWAARALFLVSDQATAEPIAFDGATSVTRPATSKPTVSLPGSVSAGDTMVLFATMGTTTTTATAPAGWSVVDTQSNGTGLRTTLFTRTATSADAGRQLTVSLSEPVKAALSIAAYSGASQTVTPSYAGDSKTTTHAAPASVVDTGGSWVINYWADKSTPATSAWTAPSGVAVRGESFGSSSLDLSSLLTDSGQPVALGPYDAGVATTDSTSLKANAWAVALTPVA